MRNTGRQDTPCKDGRSANPPGREVAGDTYGGLVDVPPDVRHDLGAVAACQNRVQRVLLDGAQEPGGVAETQDPSLPPRQTLHQVVHSNVGGCAAQDLGAFGFGDFLLNETTSH